MAEGSSTNASPVKVAAAEQEVPMKKRRFSAYINNNYLHNPNKRPPSSPVRVLLVGRPQSGKSSLVSMLINRDVQPGINAGGIFINDSAPAFPDITDISLSTDTLASTTTADLEAVLDASSDLNDDSMVVPQKPRTLTSWGDQLLSTPHNKPVIYVSDKYVVTDIDGFQEGRMDVIGTILELRRWMEESQQGYNIILMVVKAQELTETDRKVFALCNALLHDLRDMVHLVVTGCDTNPHWIEENELELKKAYGTSKAIGVAFPTTSSGLLGCIFEEMRKESLNVLEDYITKNSSPTLRMPTRAMRGGSAGANTVKGKSMKSRSFSK